MPIDTDFKSNSRLKNDSILTKSSHGDTSRVKPPRKRTTRRAINETRRGTYSVYICLPFLGGFCITRPADDRGPRRVRSRPAMRFGGYGFRVEVTNSRALDNRLSPVNVNWEDPFACLALFSSPHAVNILLRQDNWSLAEDLNP
ncbi:hypothetical protein EVAR_94110_1 [Eumeta japonica]|uniref:Uncharacterized protein n=1 Tax=Eumeta variegata TaxID=151549 RepID=A0A4C1U6R7_EUMVA|nr:hypothetical protein EVAR_94110_1 [Eumeta japonica]